MQKKKVQVIEQRPRFKLVLRQIEGPFSEDFNEEFDWLLRSFGFFGPVKGQKSAASVFREIVKASSGIIPSFGGITAVELVKRLRMSRGSVINHLNNLLLSGLIVKEGRFYRSRNPSLFRTLRWIEQDICRMFREMEEIAREIDEELGVREKE
ncbi:MAG: hypothetical protein AB1467_04185 [Candidatus Diapherotrites archaeon]